MAEEKGGSFDATGAFYAPGSSDEEDGEREDLLPPKELHGQERILKPEKVPREKEKDKGEMKDRDWGQADQCIKDSFIKMQKASSETKVSQCDVSR